MLTLTIGAKAEVLATKTAKVVLGEALATVSDIKEGQLYVLQDYSLASEQISDFVTETDISYNYYSESTSGNKLIFTNNYSYTNLVKFEGNNTDGYYIKLCSGNYLEYASTSTDPTIVAEPPSNRFSIQQAIPFSDLGTIPYCFNIVGGDGENKSYLTDHRDYVGDPFRPYWRLYATTKIKIYPAIVTYDVTYKVIDSDGNTMIETTQTQNNTQEIRPEEFSNPYVELDAGSFDSETCTYTYTGTLTSDCPFKFSKSYDDATWHFLRGYYPGHDNSNYINYTFSISYGSKPASSDSDTYLWAFLGNPYKLAIYNKSGGNNYVLTNAGEAELLHDYEASMSRLSDDSTSYYTLYRNTNTENAAYNFSLKAYNTEKTFLNNNGGHVYLSYYSPTFSGITTTDARYGFTAAAMADYTALNKLFADYPVTQLYNNLVNEDGSCFGSKVGQYYVLDDDYTYDASNDPNGDGDLSAKYTTKANFKSAYEKAYKYYSDQTTYADASYQPSIDYAYETLNWVAQTLLGSLNKPTSGMFLQISDGSNYIAAPAKAGDNETTLATTTDKTAGSTIWYYNGNCLRSYTSGYYLDGQNLITDNTQFNAGFQENQYHLSAYKIYTQTTTSGETTDHFLGLDNTNVVTTNANGSALQLKEMTSLPLTLNEANEVNITGNDNAATGTYKYFGTLCLPVNYSVSAGNDGDVKAYVITGSTTDGYIVLEDAPGVIFENTAVVLISTAQNITATVNTDATEEATPVGTNYLTGIGAAEQIESGNYYFGKKDNEAGFYKPRSTSNYLTNRGYITGDDATSHLGATTAASSSNSNGFTFSFGDDDPTGISSAMDKSEGDAFDAGAVRYNVQGQRVPQGYKGIVIINGKKYLTK